MASYVRTLRTIWSDPDFRALKAADQRVYWMLYSQPDISTAGVLPRLERRWAKLAADTDTDGIEASLLRLEAARYIRIDNETDEVWVRTYIRYDELWKVPNGRKSIEKAIGAIMSPTLAEAARNALSDAIGTASDNPSDDPSPNGSGKGRATPAASSQQPTPLPDTSSRSSEPMLAAAADEAINIWLTHRILKGEQVTNAPRWMHSTAARVRNEYATQLATVLVGEDPRKVATRVFQITTTDAWAAAAELNRRSAS